MARRLAAGLVVALGTSGILAAATPDWARPYLSRPIPEGGWIADEDTWVILRFEIEVARAPGGGLDRTYKQVLAPRGEESRTLAVALDYDAEEQDLVDPAVWVPGAFGYRSLALRKAGLDVPDPGGSGLIRSGRSLFVTTKPVDPGQKVIIAWQVRDRGSFPGEEIFWPFGAHPCAELILQVLPDGDGTRPQAFHVTPGSGDPPRRIEGELRLTDLPASRHLIRTGDPWQASPLTALPHLLIRASDEGEATWESLSSRVARLFDEAVAGDAERAWVEEARRLTAGVEGKAGRTALLASFVQSLAYRNVQWGVGGYRPEPPSESLRSGTADCKAKAILLRALLAEAGVESVPVLCRIGSPFQEEPPLPTLHAFNHVVLAIHADGPPRAAALTEGPGAGWVLFDATDPLATLGLPSGALEGSHALWVDPGHGDLFVVRSADPGASAVRADIEVRLEDAGSAAFVLTITGGSSLAATLGAERFEGDGADAARSRLQRILAAGAPGLRLEEAAFRPPGHVSGDPPLLDLRGSVPSPLLPVGRDLFTLAFPTALISIALDVKELAGRPGPDEDVEGLDLPAPWRPERCCQAASSFLEATIHLDLPEGWALRGKPGLADLDAPWLRVEVPSDPGWSLRAEVLRGRFAPGSAGARREDLARLVALLGQPFVIAAGGGPATAR